MDQHRSKVDYVWQVNMLDAGILLLGRAQYVIMKFHNKKVGFLNLYAPNSSRERLKMWIELDSSLSLVCSRRL